jgi:hypothetical protein
MLTQDPGPTETTEPIPFTDQIEQAKKSIDLDKIARAIKSAGIAGDELEYLKNMVLEARKRLEGSVTK